MNDISNVNVTDRNQMRTSVKPSRVLYLVSVLLTDLPFLTYTFATTKSRTKTG